MSDASEFAVSDASGYLINPSSSSRIESRWLTAVERGVSIYERTFGNAIAGIYIRGSVARGAAIDGWSDIDMFAVSAAGRLPVVDWTLYDSIQAEFRAEFSFATGLELLVVGHEEAVSSNRTVAQFLLSQAEHLRGQDVRIGVPRFRPSDVLRVYRGNLRRQLQTLGEIASMHEADQSRLELVSRWLGKELLRGGSLLTLPKTGQYTTHLETCHRLFSRHYSSKAKEMDLALDFVRHPTRCRNKIDQLRVEFGDWMVGEEARLEAELAKQ